MGCLAPVDTFTAQFMHLRLREYHGMETRKTVRARGLGSQLNIVSSRNKRSNTHTTSIKCCLDKTQTMTTPADILTWGTTLRQRATVVAKNG